MFAPSIISFHGGHARLLKTILIKGNNISILHNQYAIAAGDIPKQGSIWNIYCSYEIVDVLVSQGQIHPYFPDT